MGSTNYKCNTIYGHRKVKIIKNDLDFFIDLIGDEDAKEKSIEILNSNGTFLTTLPSKYLNSLSDIISFAGNFIWKFKNK